MYGVFLLNTKFWYLKKFTKVEPLNYFVKIKLLIIVSIKLTSCGKFSFSYKTLCLQDWV